MTRVSRMTCDSPVAHRLGGAGGAEPRGRGTECGAGRMGRRRVSEETPPDWLWAADTEKTDLGQGRRFRATEAGSESSAYK